MGGRKWEKLAGGAAITVGEGEENDGQEARSLMLLLLLLIQRLLKSFPKPQRFKFHPRRPRGDRQHEEDRTEPRAQRTRRPGELQPRHPLPHSLDCRRAQRR